MHDWPFSDPPNVATFTVRQVVDLEQPILLVSRDEVDGSWQFLSGASLQMSDAMLVGLGEIFALDPSIAEVADLPVGWRAERDSASCPWRRIPDGRV